MPVMKRTGIDPERPLEPREPRVVCCPICGAEEPETVIQEPGGRVLGCSECLCMCDAWEWFEEREDTHHA